MPEPATESQRVRLFVNGQGMSGGPLNGPLQSQVFIGPARTAARYRFFAVRDEFPAMLPVGSGADTGDGAEIEGELYEVELAVLRDDFMPNEPPELELAAIEMSDGSGAFAVRLRPGLEDQFTDITAIASWRRYVADRAGTTD